MSERLHASATLIQKVYRGYQKRKLYEKLLMEKIIKVLLCSNCYKFRKKKKDMN